MHTEDTAALVARMQAGDTAAFDEIFAAYQKTAVRTAALISGDTALAEDIAQEAFVQCILHIGALKDSLRFRPWFYRILTRCAWKVARSAPRADWNESLEDSLSPVTDVYPSEYADVYAALNRLSQRQRTAVILRYFNDLSLREIARATGVPEATVKTRLFAARRRLERILKEEGR